MSGAARDNTATCRTCVHFVDDPRALEAAIPGLTALSSAQSATRSDDGLCRRHERLQAARGWCGEFRHACSL